MLVNLEEEVELFIEYFKELRVDLALLLIQSKPLLHPDIRVLSRFCFVLL